ncbi:SMC-Scp complex subunit ScpB [Patescibacteria group bacterium AH-259-L07]|nr:SMC-Scp complex subunit ScpB [Patescibacteria group bacterium AH-259-L07]
MTLISTIESLLFIAHRPLEKKEMAALANESVEKIGEALESLINEYNSRGGGIKIIQNSNEYQMVTAPQNSEAVSKFLKTEITGELTPASLETLSIIAYRGPIIRDELEQIRGVNCSIILRNLLIKGLIIKADKDKQIYNVSLDFIRQLGIVDIKELPDYDRLKRDIPLSSLISEDND